MPFSINLLLNCLNLTSKINGFKRKKKMLYNANHSEMSKQVACNPTQLDKPIVYHGVYLTLHFFQYTAMCIYTDMDT